MKIEYGPWTLSLFETEYRELSIDQNCIKVVNLEGKVKKIIFRPSAQSINKVKKDKSAGITISEGSSPKVGKNSTLIDVNSKTQMVLEQNNAIEISKLNKLVENLDLDLTKKLSQMQDLTRDINDIKMVKLNEIENKMKDFEHNLENNTQNMTKLNEEMKTFINWRKAKLNTGIDTELLRKMEESAKDLEKTFKKSYKGRSNKNYYY